MSRLQSLLSSLLFAACFLLEPVFALAVADDKPPPEYVLSYFLLLLFLGLAILILLRPSLRKDSALTQDEVDAEKAKTAGKKGH